MSSFVDDSRRQIIPRWRDFATTAALGELAFPQRDPRSIVSPVDFFAKKLARWRRDRSKGVAADLVASAFVMGRQAEVNEAAIFLLESSEEGSVNRDLANQVVGNHELGLVMDSVAHDSKPRVRAIRHQLSDEPRDAVLWTDLSREYTILGHLSQAKRAIENALRLAPSNRFVLRAAARLFIHLDDPDRAYNLLKTTEGSKTDPWLLAAEIAAASVAGRSSRLAKRGVAIARSQTLFPRQITELASAVATLEMENGARKSARRLFQTSLLDPTDNSLAQASFHQQHVGEIEVGDEALAIPRSYEARAWRGYQAKNWSGVVAACRNWMLDEPFSVQPAILGSFTTLVMIGAPKEAERFLETALRVNNSNARLHNNYAVALAEQNHLLAAQKALDKALCLEQDPSVRAVFLKATGGLIAFRKGQIEKGRIFYGEAIEAARRQSSNRSGAALARVYMLREEALAGNIAVKEVVQLMREESESTGLDVAAFVSKIEDGRPHCGTSDPPGSAA